MSDADQFEDKYMKDGSRILHRDKKVSRALAGFLTIPALVMLMLAVVIPLINGSSAKPMPDAMVPAFAIFMALLSALYFVMAIGFAVLRIVITEKAINVKYGLWGPTIPLDAILDTKVIDYEWTKYGGWGIRRGTDGSRAYVSSSGKVVQVRYTDEKGQAQTVVLGGSDANLLREQIEKARGGATATAAAKPVRIAQLTEEERVRLAEAEAETEALLAEDSRSDARSASRS